MPLNNSKGNMYDFVTHTWNTIKGRCYHDCSYCYMKRWGQLNRTRFDEKELKTDLEKDNFIFVGSSNDMFSKDIPEDWITRTLDYCDKFNNRYLFQSKNPRRIVDFLSHPVFRRSSICTTIETNRKYEQMGCAPDTWDRAFAMNDISLFDDYTTYVTIEPIMDFELDSMVSLIRECNPTQVNIGADSGRNNLPEPSTYKVNELIMELSSFTNVVIKPNLNRLLK